MQLSIPGLRLRVADASDEPALGALYASSRERELAMTPWTDAEKAVFCDLQYQAQHSHYRSHYPTAVYWMIERVADRDGTPIAAQVIGRLYWARLRTEPEDILMEMTLKRELRGGGLGTAIVREVLRWAAEDERRVSLHVEIGNPSAHLCERLGFVHVGGDALIRRYVWHPPSRV
ncbi:MAG: GNAT family N-acetyltransferase [Burkholderiales bacterium]|nr:GNAT family N-acetyltransferase [Burkholderiales bacterium]MCZ2135982.1 GNAT family N-acetyltransferase [Burkholderiales bacterium]